MRISEVKQQLNSLVNRVYRKETRVLVKKSGIPVAGLVSAANLRRLNRIDRERKERYKAFYEFAAGFADQTLEEIERETARALAEVRAERRAENLEVLDSIGEAFKDVPEVELEREQAEPES